MDGRIMGNGVIGMPEISNISFVFEGAGASVKYEENGHKRAGEVLGIRPGKTGLTSAQVNFILDKGRMLCVKNLSEREIRAVERKFGLTEQQKSDLRAV